MTFLDQIIASKREEVAERSAAQPLAVLKERVAGREKPRNFFHAVTNTGRKKLNLIAEIKKASPSAGVIREDFDPVAIARTYAAGGADALSVLTDEKFFQGSLENLRRASAAAKLPCLRKDFMVDEFQVLEARANSADAILLIMAALPDVELRRLRDAARAYDLDVLCEVHDAEELERALALDCECVGVNSRDLRTFEVSLDRACELAAKLPKDVVKVAESGIHSAADMKRLRAAGYDAFLIGESLMRSAKPGEALKALLNESAG